MRGRSEARFRRAIGQEDCKRLAEHALVLEERQQAATRRTGASRTGCGDEKGTESTRVEAGDGEGWRWTEWTKGQRGGGERETREKEEAFRRLSCVPTGCPTTPIALVKKM